MLRKCRVRFCILAVLAIILVLVIPCTGADTAKPVKPEFDITKLLSIEHVTSEIEEQIDDAGFGPSRLIASPEDWERRAQRHQQRLSELDSNEYYPPPVQAFYAYSAAAAVTAEEIAIEKYRNNPSGVANDEKISDAYIRLSQTYEYLGRLNPGYYEYQLDALNEATDALPTNRDAWDQKIDLLNQLGRTEEAQQAQADYDRIQRQTEAGHSLFDALMPADILVVVLSAAAGLGLIALRKQRKQG